MSRVVVVDDHELIAETVRLALSGSGFDVTVIAPRPLPDLFSALLEARPDLVLLDLDLGAAGDSTELIAPLVRAGSRVLVVTGTVDRLRVAAALERGAVGYHPKSQGFERMLARTHAALDADGPLDLEERGRLLEELARSRAEQDRVFGPFRLLTDREQDTLQALGQGNSVQEIADDWVVSEATVRSHVRGVLTKLGAPSQLAAVARAMHTGWFAAKEPAAIRPR